MPFSRFDLSILSVEQYRKDIKNKMLQFKRSMPMESTTDSNKIAEIEIAHFLIDNQIKRFTIIKEEDEKRENIKERMKREIEHEITPIESLGKLPDIEILDKEYFMLQSEYNFRIQKLRTDQDQFMSEFLQYIEFHQSVLNQYKYETNEMFIQAATQITAQHHKEIEIKKTQLSEFEKQRQEFEKRE